MESTAMKKIQIHLQEELASSGEKIASGNHMNYTEKEHAQRIPYNPHN